MGVVPSKNVQTTSTSTKRRSTQLDFSSLGPLKTSGTVGFSTFREHGPDSSRRRKARKKSNAGLGPAMDDDSDDDDDDNEANEMLGKIEDIDDKDVKTTLGPDDAKFSGELAAGVDRIKVRRPRVSFHQLLCHPVY